jgi:ethanolamine utilization protein EutQ (cupin superfamily)
MCPIETYDPQKAVLREYPFGATGTVKSWQPLGDADPGSLGAGVCEYRGVFDWDLHYDAVYYMISGSLTVIDGDGEHTVVAGQMMSIPKGSKGRYVSPEGCRLFWAIFPGNWEEISDFSINGPAAGAQRDS